MFEEYISIVAGIIASIIGAAVTSSIIVGRYQEKVDQLERRECKRDDKIDLMRSDIDKVTTIVSGMKKM